MERFIKIVFAAAVIGFTFVDSPAHASERYWGEKSKIEWQLMCKTANRVNDRATCSYLEHVMNCCHAGVNAA